MLCTVSRGREREKLELYSLRTKTSRSQDKFGFIMQRTNTFYKCKQGGSDRSSAAEHACFCKPCMLSSRPPMFHCNKAFHKCTHKGALSCKRCSYVPKGHGTVNPTMKQQQHLPMPSHKLMCSNLVQPGRLHAVWLLQKLAQAKVSTHMPRNFTHLFLISLHAKLQSQPSDWKQINDTIFEYLLFDCSALLISPLSSKAREKPWPA